MKLLLSKPSVACIAVLLSFMLIIMPITVDYILAQDSATACLDAERAAETDVNGTTWFFIGCILGWVGWLIGSMSDSSPSAGLLLGKSPEYVAIYTDCYKKKSKDIKSTQALYGCLLGTAITVGLYIALVAAAVDEANDPYYD